MANALLSGVCRHRWAGSAADTAFELVRQMPVDCRDDPGDLARAWDLSRRYDQGWDRISDSPDSKA
ncbi:MAG: hypothetical protein ABI873_19460 [Marmoricola sp.]